MTDDVLVLDGGDPLEPLAIAVGRRSATLVDATRDDRPIAIECWYPATAPSGARSTYEVLPGLHVAGAATDDAPARPDPAPLLVWSHGRIGTRTSYTKLCEGLAARGYVVIALDHVGDRLGDWLSGEAVDDETNNVQRVADTEFVIRAARDATAPFTAGLTIDPARIAVAGHSYGGYTSLALAGTHGEALGVRAVAGLQALTRNLHRSTIEAITVPAMLIVGSLDATTPPATDGDRAFALLRGTPDARRLTVTHAGHQACSDTGLYVELAPQATALPDIVREFVRQLDGQVTGTPGEPWRPTVHLHLRALAAWLDDVLDRDVAAARAEWDAVAATPGVQVDRKGQG